MWWLSGAGELAYLDQYSINVANPFCWCSDGVPLRGRAGAIGQNSTTLWTSAVVGRGQAWHAFVAGPSPDRMLRSPASALPGGHDSPSNFLPYFRTWFHQA